MTFDVVGKIIVGTIEYQHWGANALTVSFLISTVLTIISGWGLVQQHKTIWHGRIVAAVSVTWLAYYGVLQLAILIYGISLHSMALIINGLLTLFYIPLLAGLWKFKGFTVIEKISLSVFVLAIAAMAILPYTSSFFFAFAIGGLFSAVMQPIEMWRKKSAAGLNIRLIGTIIIGNIVWFVYGLAVMDWVLMVINAIAFLIFGTTTLLWWQYRKEPIASAQALEDSNF